MTKSPTRARVHPFDYVCPRHTAIDSLLVHVGGGDHQAFSAFYDQLSRTVYARCLDGGLAPGAAAQVTEDVFLQAWRQAPSYDTQAESAWTWLNALTAVAIRGRTKETLEGAQVLDGPLQLVGGSHE